jgi:ATP-dependent Clp protease ATP-binding subunit ClpA
VVLILTSNVVARVLWRRLGGLGQWERLGDSDVAFRRFFSPEFRIRLDA